MHVLLHEIRKLFSWRMLLIVFLANLILYFLLIEFHITNFPNGRPSRDLYNIGVEMIDKYGTYMDEKEIENFINVYKAKVKEADAFLQSRKEFVDAHLDSYEKLRHLEFGDERMELSNQIMFDENVDLFWKLQAREYIMEEIQTRETYLASYLNEAKGAQKERYQELLERGRHGLYPSEAMSNYQDFISNVAIAIIISVIIIISPIFIKDRTSQMLELQYTTKKGRALFKTKVAAGVMAAIIVMTVLFAIYFSLYSLNHTSMFFNLPIYLFTWFEFWYDVTFFQYIVITVLAIYILGMVFALFSMFFSNRMANYVSLIGIQIPFIIALIAVLIPYLVRRLMDLDIPKWIAPTSYTVMALSSVILVVLLWVCMAK